LIKERVLVSLSADDVTLRAGRGFLHDPRRSWECGMLRFARLLDGWIRRRAAPLVACWALGDEMRLKAHDAALAIRRAFLLLVRSSH